MNREGFVVNDTTRECTKCSSIFTRTNKTVTLCPTCNSNRVKCTSPEKKMLARARSRAKLKGREFNITLDDIKIPKTCPILGIELVVNSGKPGGLPNSPSLDRLDPTRGYSPDNILVISQRANLMKADASKEEILLMASWAEQNL